MEWAFLPELCIMAHGAMELSLRVVSGLHVYPDMMLRNLDATHGSLLAERVMLTLGKFIGRQHAHDAVHEAAMKAFEERIPMGDVLKQDPAITAYLGADMIDALLDPAQYTGLSGVLVDQVLKNAGL